MNNWFSKKRGQVGTEYLIVVGFITFAIMTIVVIAFTMSNSTKDQLIMKQVQSFSSQLINSAESIYFEGEPSKSTTNLYLPAGVQSIIIYPEGVYFEIQLYSGLNKILYESRVPLNGSITTSEGTKKLLLEATADYVNITQA